MQKDSIMEERARRFDYFSQFIRALPAPGTTDEVKNEINYLNKRLSLLSREMKAAKKTLTDFQKQFTFYANYKNALERTITPLTLVPSPSSRERKVQKLSFLQKLENLSPERQEKLTKLIKKETSNAL